MSESTKEPSNDVVDSKDDDGSGRRKKTKQRGHGCGANHSNSKKLALFRFRKGDKHIHRRNKIPSNPSSSSSYCCFKQTPTLDSPVDSPKTDANSTDFNLELLRVLIEKNDFYSEKCNPHLDIDNRG